MIKKLYKDEKGMTAAMAAFIILVLIAVSGLVLDGSLLVYQRARLEAATEGAAMGSVLGYDTDLYNNNTPPIIFLKQAETENYARTYLNANMPEAVLVSCTIDNSDPYHATATIKTKMDVELTFMRAFGINTSTIRTTVVGHAK